MINKIDFTAKNLTSNAGLFLLLENAKSNGIFDFIENDLVFDNDSTNKIKMNHIRINYAVRFFCRIEREKTKPMAFSVANMQNMGLLIPISMCGHKQDSVFFIRRHDKETYGYSIF